MSPTLHDLYFQHALKEEKCVEVGIIIIADVVCTLRFKYDQILMAKNVLWSSNIEIKREL